MPGAAMQKKAVSSLLSFINGLLMSNLCYYLVQFTVRRSIKIRQ